MTRVLSHWAKVTPGPSPAAAALVAGLSPAGLRGRYQGVATLGFALAQFVSPVVGGYVLQHAGPTGLWLGCLGLGILVALGQLAAHRPRERRLAIVRALTASPTPVPAPRQPEPAQPETAVVPAG